VAGWPRIVRGAARGFPYYTNPWLGCSWSRRLLRFMLVVRYFLGVGGDVLEYWLCYAAAWYCSQSSRYGFAVCVAVNFINSL
jgi:hypothetical protein